MGMSTKELEAQKADKSLRFYIDRDDDRWCVVDRQTGEVVGYDGGEPEDQTLVRNWQWVCEALNRVNVERDREIAELRAALRQVVEAYAQTDGDLDPVLDSVVASVRALLEPKKEK